MRYARWVLDRAGTTALEATERHVRAHLSSVADGGDDPDRYAGQVQVCRVGGEGGTTVVGELPRRAAAPYLPALEALPAAAAERAVGGLAFARAVMDGLARHGVRVLTEPGWENRGNGQTADYQGAHGETSITGKWDPGFALDRTIDMNRFRADVKAVRGGPGLPTSHVVARGDTLSAIAKRYYGRSDRWRDIHAANRSVIGPDPDRLVPGQVLVIPA